MVEPLPKTYFRHRN